MTGEDLIRKLNQTKQELDRVKNELQVQTWGLNKTNEGIKILYKELQKKTEQLKKLDKLKSDFVSAVSHELRTPLTTIRDIVMQVQEGLLGKTTKQQREFLTICLEDIDRLVRTVNNLLDISKIEAGKVQINREPVKLVELVRRISSAFGPRAEIKNLNIKTVFSDEQIQVYADKDKIIQVFNNLLGNALKFTEKGNIEISVVDKQDYIECCVSDTGRGIPEDKLGRVFNKFEQFGRMPGPGEKGTGLGLAISKGIIELHQGKIWAESKLSQGTRISFSLPKCTVWQLLKQNVTDRLKQAIEQEKDLSVLIFEVNNFTALCKQMDKDKLSAILGKLEELTQGNLRSSEDKVIKSGRESLIVLSAIKKAHALFTAERLKQVFNDYLSKEIPDKQIDLAYRVVSYPQDGKTQEELLGKVIRTDA